MLRFGRAGSRSLNATTCVRFDTLAASFRAWCVRVATVEGIDRAQLRRWAHQRGLNFLGAGAARAVFEVPEGALKLAYDTVTSNLNEAKVFAEVPAELRPYLVPVLDHDPAGTWLLMSKVTVTGRGVDRFPEEIRRRLDRCGLADIYSGVNLSDDGRVVDYGWIHKPIAWATCAKPGGEASLTNFARWFGHSQVVDALGAPKRVYHGTNQGFESFDRKTVGSGVARHDPVHTVDAFWFTENQDVANYFADQAGGNVMPLYLRLQNPLIVDCQAWATKMGTTGDSFRLPTGRVYHIHFWKKRVADQARAEGRDGVIFQDGYDGVPAQGDVYAVFDPTSVKSATGNRGTWDGKDPRVSFNRVAKRGSRDHEKFGTKKPLCPGFMYRLKQSERSMLLVIYAGLKKIGGVLANWTYSMEDYDKPGRCGRDLRALGVNEPFPRVLQVYKTEIEAAYQGRGLGRAMYEALMAEAWDARGRSTEAGPFFFVPGTCSYIGTSKMALRVWASLAKDYPSSGLAIRVDRRPTPRCVPRGSSAKAPSTTPRAVSVRLLYASPQKLVDTMRDVREGRLSYSRNEPLTVSALDTPRGAFYVLDGHHRLVERIEAGDVTVPIVLNPHLPRIERTGGGYAHLVAQKVRVVDVVRPQ